MARSELQDEPFGRGEVTLYFDDVAVTSGDNTYRIRPYVDSGNRNLSWYRRSNCYVAGKAFEGNVSQGYDFGFATYGYNFAVPAESPDEVEEGPGEEEEEVEEEPSGEREEEEEEPDDEIEEEPEEVMEAHDLQDSEDEQGDEQEQTAQEGEETETVDGGDEQESETRDVIDGRDAQEIDQEHDKISGTTKKEEGERKYSINELLLLILFAASALLVVLTVGYLAYKSGRKTKVSHLESEVKNERTVKKSVVVVVIVFLSLILLALIWFGRVADDETRTLDFEFSRKKSIETTITPTQEIKRDQEESNDWLKYVSEKYDYSFKHPQGAEIKKATKDFFRLTPEEHAQGMTLNDKLEEYSSDICLILEHRSGTIRVSASPNKNKDVVMCSGITGVGFDCTIQEKNENVRIGSQEYEAKGNAITCPSSDYREVFRIEFEDGTGIEYILRTCLKSFMLK